VRNALLRDTPDVRGPYDPALPNGVVTYAVENGSSLTNHMELIGSRFGHIRIVGVLGQGGMGDVYAGYDETLQRRVALKAIRPEQRLDLEARSRLIREARTLSQLEHPNICRIYDYIEGKELGKDVDLLVLELIEGKTLEESLRHGLSPAEKLRIADAMARVLVAAHRAGIIHRDLKPENVMLTPAGEVKVLDFGLARWTEKSPGSGPAEAIKPAASIRTQLLKVAPEVGADWLPVEDGAVASTLIVTPPAPADKRRDRGVMATAAGVTMGTPLYMSPEQARGETLTPASDMYSFGLVMQTLFTGREPYDATMTGREVMQAASRGESLPVHGADRDITALVNRLKQLAPTDRPTAVEALDRLRWIAERPKRLARRISAAAVILVVVLSAWKYVTDLRRERAAAVAAETEARARRDQAEKLISFMVYDLRTKLEPVGRLDILNDVADKALAYVRALDQTHVSATELAQNSKALDQLGEVRIAQGDVSASMPVFTQALRLAEGASRRDPHSEQALLAVGTSHFWIGNAYRLQGNTPSALAHMRAYLNCTERLTRMNPASDQYQIELANGHSVVGAMLEAQSDLRGAMAHYQTTLAIRQANIAARPHDGDALADLARAINKLGVVATKLGDPRRAREQFETEAGIYNSLLRTNPRQNQWKQRLASSYGFLSSALADTGERDRAIEISHRELAIEDDLCALDPANVSWERNRAIAHARVGRLLRYKGDISGAAAEVGLAEKNLTALVARDAKRADLQRDLATVQVINARVLMTSGNLAAARAKTQAAIAVLTSILTRDRASSESLAEAYMVLADVLDESRSATEAASARAKAAGLTRPTTNTADPRLLARWARLLLSGGDISAARAIVARLDAAGYHDIDLDIACKKRGC
jgi:serine/threonine protein kinase